MWRNRRLWRLTLKPKHVLVYEWVGRKHICIDLPEVSHLWNWRLRFLLWTRSSQSSFKQNIQTSYYDNQHVLTPFMFDAFDFLTSEVVNFHKKFKGSCITMLCLVRCTINVMFKIIDFTIKRISNRAYCMFYFTYVCVILIQINFFWIHFFKKAVSTSLHIFKGGRDKPIKCIWLNLRTSVKLSNYLYWIIEFN